MRKESDSGSVEVRLGTLENKLQEIEEKLDVALQPPTWSPWKKRVVAVLTGLCVTWLTWTTQSIISFGQDQRDFAKREAVIEVDRRLAQVEATRFTGDDAEKVSESLAKVKEDVAVLSSLSKERQAQYDRIERSLRFLVEHQGK